MQKRIRWGILSCAKITESVIPAIKKSRYSRLVAVSSRDIDKVRHTAKRYDIERFFSSYEDMLDRDIIDAVYIPVVNNLHYKWSMEALKRGINVLCEKPFTLNSTEARRLIDFARRKGLLIREGFMYRFHPQYSLVRSLILSERIGRIKSIYSTFTFMNDDPESYLMMSAFGGGSLMDVGCYSVHLSRMVTGREPLSVYATSTGRDVDTTMIGIMRFEGDIISTFESSISSFERHLAIIRGEKGEILLDNPWLSNKKGGVTLETSREKKIFKFEKIDLYRMEIDDVSLILLKKQRNNFDIYDPYKNMRVIDALKQSDRSKKPIYLRHNA